MADIGIVGVGKMGANMAECLRRAVHQVVGVDSDEDSARDVASLGEPAITQFRWAQRKDERR